jgi:ribonuclease HII
MQSGFFVTIYFMITGIDEAGRGAWAGPLVAAAVVWPTTTHLDGQLNDSKQLSAIRRNYLARQIRSQALGIGIGWVSATMIDHIGLTQAVQQAMNQAYQQIAQFNAKEVIIDGPQNHLKLIPNTRAVIRADQTVLAVMAASIIAKVTRDLFMYRLAQQNDQFGFAQHKGYGTALHRQRLSQHGPGEEHRYSYRPVKEV